MSAGWSLMLTNPDKKKAQPGSQVEVCESPKDNGPMNRHFLLRLEEAGAANCWHSST
jgi:hypothetical protein